MLITSSLIKQWLQSDRINVILRGLINPLFYYEEIYLMLTIINHLSAFWTVVIMNCIQPVNWQYCYRIDQWLIPDIYLGAQIYFDKKMNFLYKSEKEYLNKL